MKQIEIKALCKQYLEGSISDAHLLLKLQVSDEVKSLMWGVTALPMSAQLRIRIEDLQLDEKPKAKTKIKKEQTYLQRLAYFVLGHWEDEHDAVPWRDPEISASAERGEGAVTVYKFTFRRASLARALFEQLKSVCNKPVSPLPANELSLSINNGSAFVLVAEPHLQRVKLVPTLDEITEIF